MTASDDQTIRIWNWQSRACVAQLTGHSHYVMCAQFHPKDDLVVSASLDQTIRVWDISHLRRKGSLTPVDDGFGSARSSSGQIDLFASSDGQVKFILEGHDRGVNWVQFHPTKPMIISGSDDRSVKLWRYNDSRAWETDTFRGHFNNVSCVVFHPTLDLILSASEDKTIRVWDYSKRGAQPQTFRRDHDRYWILAVHPYLGTFAAGHDAGMQVFKLERERPPQILLDDSLFFMKGPTLVRRDLNKAAAAETNLVTLTQAPVLPALLDYSAADKAFLVSYGNEYELVSRSGKKGIGSHAMFLSSGRFLVFDATEQSLFIKSINDNANVGVIRCPIPGVEHVFAAPDNCVLLTSPVLVSLFDLDSQTILVEANVPRVKRVAWSPDNSRCALMSKKGITLMDRTLNIISTINEAVPIKSGVWDQHQNLFYYTSPHHLKYMLPSGETGIICTIENPLYLVRIRGDIVQALDRQASLVTLHIDPAEYIFKLALLEQDLPRVMSIIENHALVGQSVISYLRQHGYAAIALQFVDDPMGRFELALECANWEVALDAAEHIDIPDIWNSLGEQARKLGNYSLAKLAFGNSGNEAELLHLAALTGDVPVMRSASQESSATGIQASMMLGDSLNLAKTLEGMGLHSLAYLAYRNAGVKQNPPNGVSVELPEKEGVIQPVRATNPCDEPWPLSHPLINLDLPSPAPLRKNSDPLAGTHDFVMEGHQGEWEMDDGLRMEASAPQEDEFTDFAVGSDNPLLQTKLPVYHLLAGSIDSTKKLLQQQAGVVDFEPLQPMFEHSLQLQAYGAFINRFEDAHPFVTLVDLQSKLQEGLTFTTAGKFVDAIKAFEWVLHGVLFTVLQPGESVSDLIEEAREYLVGLRMELKRKELIASAGGNELEGKLATRVLELACYFTSCKLRPEHLILALRSAMTLSFKLKQFDLSSRMAHRLIDLQPGEAISAQAQKVLAVAKSSAPSGVSLDIQYDDHLDFDIDPTKFTPIYFGGSSEACPLCGALYGAAEKGTVCRICRVSGIGASTTGLHLCLE